MNLKDKCTLVYFYSFSLANVFIPQMSHCLKDFTLAVYFCGVQMVCYLCKQEANCFIDIFSGGWKSALSTIGSPLHCW